MLLWAGHALAGYAGGYGQSDLAGYGSHSHSQDDELSEQPMQQWGDHQHSSLMVDHAHETPHLSPWLSPPEWQSTGRPLFAYVQRLANGPNKRIERPPRS